MTFDSPDTCVLDIGSGDHGSGRAFTAAPVTSGSILAGVHLTVWALVVGGLVWAGMTLLFDARRHHHRPSLAERLAPFHPEARLGDEAEEWLHRQGRS